MKEKTIQYEHKASTKEYLVALAYSPCFTKLLKPEAKVYKQLHDWLMEKQVFLANEDSRFPSVKEIALELKIDSSKIAKYVRMIYEDIHELNEKQPDLFKTEGQNLCFLSFNYLEQYAHFNLGLNAIPRHGETFHFYFVKPKNGGQTFYVNDVVHSFDNGRHEIRVYLNHEYPITYMQLLKEKAYLNRDISFMELLSASNFSLEEKLVKLYRNL